MTGKYARASKFRQSYIPVNIAEIYRSIQGEGLLTGTPSVFVRTSGCNLRCWFCDTPYTSWQPEGRPLCVADVVQQTLQLEHEHVVITGGEPMLFAELVELTSLLHAQGRHITIETAGTRQLPVVCDLMSVSPKFASSAPSAEEHPAWHARHQQERFQPKVLAQLFEAYAYQCKFVVDTPADLQEVDNFLLAFPALDLRRVLLMPQGNDVSTLQGKRPWIEQACQERGCTFCPRMHLHWFGPGRGT